MLKSFIDQWEGQAVRLHTDECLGPNCDAPRDHKPGMPMMHYVDGISLGLQYQGRFRCLAIKTPAYLGSGYGDDDKSIVHVRLKNVLHCEPLPRSSEEVDGRDTNT